jgi:hypothetical protein
MNRVQSLELDAGKRPRLTIHTGGPPGKVKRATGAGSQVARGVAVDTANSTASTPSAQPRTLPYGAYRLLEKRYRNKVPVGSILIAERRCIGTTWGARIVVGDQAPATLDFTVVAGLPVIVAGYDQHRIELIVDALKRYRPRRVVSVNYAETRIAPHYLVTNR